MAKGPKVNPSTMLWFIRSRSYMPVHEIRRRFGIEGEESTVVYDGSGPVYMGLPPKPASVLLELSTQGKIGLECSVEHRSRIVIGVFPMHPAREEGTLRPPSRPPRFPYPNGAPNNHAGPPAPGDVAPARPFPARPIPPRRFPNQPAGPRPPAPAAGPPPALPPRPVPQQPAPPPPPPLANAPAARYPTPRVSFNGCGGNAAADDHG